jgi:hypothetical protein
MKRLQHLFAPVALTLLLSGPAFAGTMSTWEDPPPPPPPPPALATTTSATLQADGIIWTGVPSADPVTMVALNLLQSVLAQF